MRLMRFAYIRVHTSAYVPGRTRMGNALLVPRDNDGDLRGPTANGLTRKFLRGQHTRVGARERWRDPSRDLLISRFHLKRHNGSGKAIREKKKKKERHAGERMWPGYVIFIRTRGYAFTRNWDEITLNGMPIQGDS
ncbi:hypothetical protein PUN28_013329 [Cardiocondyla obscurior]|uniref:Ribosomal protein L2 n=1 Tax=Cardiocondyla obscurior TaxID=286306 RepID=A0AAW2FBX6_9HYME